MGRKEKRKKKAHEGQEKTEAPKAPVISRRGWKVIGAGLGTVVLGFFVLSLTDPRGQNFASTLSPFLLIGGYTLIGFGIVAKDPSS